MIRKVDLVRGVARAPTMPKRGVTPVEPMPEAKRLPAIFHRIEVPEARGFPQFNPSVHVRYGELLATVRVQMGARSENYLGVVEDWSLKSTQPFQDLPKTVHGYEDLRLFEFQNKLMAVGSTYDGVKSSMTLLLLDERDKCVDLKTLFESETHEKNWMPLVSNNQLRLVRSLLPLDIVDYEARRPLKPIDNVRLRGGSQFVKYDGRWVGIAHKTYWTNSGRVYLHHVVTLDESIDDVIVLQVGPPFYFQRLGIEFCAGLARWEGRWVLSFGLDDREAWLAVSDLNEVRP